MSENSFRPEGSARRRSFARLIGDIHQELNRVLTAQPSVTKAELARRLNVDRAIITRRLNGTSNMTLESLSDLAWAMNKRVKVRLEDRPTAVGANAAPEAAAPVDSVDIGAPALAGTNSPMHRATVQPHDRLGTLVSLDEDDVRAASLLIRDRHEPPQN